MDKRILKELKVIKNINNELIATKLDGYKIIVDREIIEGFIEFLNESEPKNLDVDDMVVFLLRNQLLNLLVIDGYEVKLKND